VAQPVSGLYVGAGVGANWLIGGEGNVLNRRPGDLLARLLGAPDFATLQRNVAAEARAAEARVEAALAEAARAAARETALQAAADNPALPPAARAVAAQLLPEARAAAAQAATQAIASRGLAQAAQAVSNAATAVQDLSRSAKISFDVGWVGVASLGWGFGNGLRAEVEGNYRTNDVDQVTFLGLSTASGGRVRSYGVLGNLFYDFDLGFVQPYVGLGAGYVWTEYRKLRASALGLTVALDDGDGKFAFQGIAGVAVPLTRLGVRGLTLTAEYRFLGTFLPKVEAELRAGGADGLLIARRELDAGNFGHSALLGVRYAFNQPAPAPALVDAPVQPAAAPAPQAARAYLVSFDSDRADLTGRAREVIAEAARNARRAQATRIELAGHADRSGSPRHDERLSRRRAETVASELVARGISREQIGVASSGGSRPLVPTADGVRGPQGRRVEIALR
jgi:outer membrane protein OmpA-like peptidoglycan-associated protein/outer membrane protein W